MLNNEVNDIKIFNLNHKNRPIINGITELPKN